MKNRIISLDESHLNKHTLELIKNIDLQSLKQRSHFPVMLKEVLVGLNLKKDGVYLDCTFGAGGYSEYILECSNASVIAIDRDESVKKFTEKIKAKYNDRFHFFLNTFSNYNAILDSLNIDSVDGIIMDIGFSNMQIADPSRGFSFKQDGSLKMTMGLNKHSAQDFINKAEESLLADVIYYYGEEHKAKQIAKNIVKHRKVSEILTTLQLAQIVKEITGFGNYQGKGHRKTDGATKTFQAIRIYINEELHQLEKALELSKKYLKSSGVLAVVSFHSLEDRIVKDFINKHGIYKNTHNKFTLYKEKTDTIEGKYFNIITKKPIVPSNEELAENLASSSAKLRLAEKI